MTTIRVLVADDNPTQCQQQLEVLGQAGFEAAGTGAAEEFLQLAQRLAPNLILINLSTGGSLGRRLLGLVPKAPALRRALVVALVPSGGWPEAIPTGVELMQRPDTPEKLADQVKQVLLRHGPDGDPTYSLPGMPADMPGDMPADMEDVIIDEDVSAADLTGEVLLPLEEEAPPDGIPDVTAPRIVLPPGRFPEIRQRAEALALDAGEALLAGDLAAVPLIDVLGLLSRQRQTGVLVVSAAGTRIEATFSLGRIAQCTATGLPDLRLGRFVRELETITQEEIDAVATKRPAPGGTALLGLRLCQVGYLSRDELRQVLARQTTEFVYEMLRPATGRFVFARPPSLPPGAVDRSLGAALELDVDSLLLEGYRRIRDWHLMEGEVAEGAIYLRAEERGAHLDRPEWMGRIGLTREEQQVLSLCTGRNSLSEIARASRLPALEVSRILQRLQAVHLVRRRVPPAVA